MSDEHDPPSIPPPFDINDPDMRRWLVHLRVAFDDLDSVFRDALRPMRRRRLGYVQHRELYREAREAIVAQLDAVLRPPPHRGGGDPSAH
jgi:hypothetical protein